MTAIEVIRVRTVTQGTVPEGAQEFAAAKVRSVLRRVTRPVLAARVTLTMSADPAVARPALAQATIDVNGRVVRAQAAGRTMRDAIELMTDRLRARLRRTVRPRFALWRRGAARTPRRASHRPGQTSWPAALASCGSAECVRPPGRGPLPLGHAAPRR
jgi:ribosome-associated translation inhibitor RaiA